jgi:hypothetical protein
MPKAENIDHFNRVVLVVFDRLYSQFPVAVDLSVAEIAELASPGSLPESPAYKHLEPTFESIQFLAAEGFLTYSSRFLEGTTFTTVKLTLKGLTVLGQIPDSLERKQTLIERMRSALAGGSKEAASEIARQLVIQAFTLAPAAGTAAMAAINNGLG